MKHLMKSLLCFGYLHASDARTHLERIPLQAFEFGRVAFGADGL